MAQFSAGLSEVIAPAPWPTPEFLPGAAPYASETWDNGISLLHRRFAKLTRRSVIIDYNLNHRFQYCLESHLRWP
jgi:hypothetical protein